MTDQELRLLVETSNARIDELLEAYRQTGTLTRRQADALRRCVHRIGTVAYEHWIAAGRPTEGFEIFQQGPPKLSPLPASMRPLDLTARPERGIN